MKFQVEIVQKRTLVLEIIADNPIEAREKASQHIIAVGFESDKESEMEWAVTSTELIDVPAPEFTPNTNIRELMEYAMTIRDENTAKVFWNNLIDWSLANWNVPGRPATREEAESIQRSNIGYWAGYYRPEVAERVRKFFAAAHPIFG